MSYLYPTDIRSAQKVDTGPNLTSAVNQNVISFTITPGTWAINAMSEFRGGALINVTGPQQTSISAVSATHGTLGINSSQALWTNATLSNQPGQLNIPEYILTVTSNTTIYMVMSANFNAGACLGYGKMVGIKIY